MSLVHARRFAFAVVIALSPLAIVACGGAPDSSTEMSSSEELSKKKAHFETFTGVDGQQYFDLLAANGQNVLRSEGYDTDEGAQSGIASVVANGVDPQAYEVKQAKDGQWYFDLVAANGAIVATSETYVTKSNATRGASTVRAIVGQLGATPAPKLQRFEIFTGEDAQVYFRLRAGNGEIVLSSEGYAQHQGALDGVASVKANGTDAAHFRILEARDGQYAFDLLAANGQIIASSETYVSRANAERAVARIAAVLAGSVPTKG